MMPGSEFVRTGNGQWTKVPGSRLAESILHRSLSRELGLSLRAETINDGNGKYFPPTAAIQRILAPCPQPIPSSSIASSIANSLTGATSSILRDTDPAQDDYKLFTRSRRTIIPTTTAEQVKIKAPAATVAVNHPPPPIALGIDGKEKSVRAKEKAPSEEIPITLFAAANRAAMEKSAMKLERLLKFEADLERKKAACPPPSAPAPIDPEDLLPKYCPLNPDLPEEFKGMSVNQIFEVCYNRCLAKGKVEDEERARKALESADDENDDDKNSESSIVSSDACSEDLPFISSVNVLSMRKREIQRQRKKQAAIDAELGIVHTSSSSAGTPEEDTAVDAGEMSFASGISDPSRDDDTPLFTIRSKKQPIKIVDPKTLQRPDKPKSPKDLANDVEFLKRGLRVLTTGAELSNQSYQMFKTVGMDSTVLAQTSEWCKYIQEFVRNTSATLQNIEGLKKIEVRNAIFEQVGQCMGHKKKMDNSILGWTNFAISMFPVEVPLDGKESPPESRDGVRLEDQPNEKTLKVRHQHGKPCQDLNHELQKLTEDNKLKFTTLLRMLIDSLSECKDWILKAPSYAKAKPLRYTKLKPVEALLVPSIEVGAPGEAGTKRGNQGELMVRQESSGHIHITENENPRGRAMVQEVEIKEQMGQGLSAELNQQAFYHAQQAVSWYQSGYMMHGYNQQGRSNGEYIQNSGGQVLRPRSAVNQQMNNDGYHQSQHHGNFQQELTSRQVQRSQHNISRGRQGTRSGGQSRQPSTVGVRQTYGNPHPVSHAPQHLPTFTSTPTSEYLYNPETSAYQEIRYPYSQAPGVHQPPVLQHPQPWRTIGTSDGSYLESNHPPPFSNNRSTPDAMTTSGEYMRQDRTTAHAAPQQQQRSMTVTPQVMQHPGMMHTHHSGNEQYGNGHGIAYSQAPSGVYSGYGHTAWHSHNGHPMQQSQQPAVQGRSGKAMMYQPYGHHPGQYRL